MKIIVAHYCDLSSQGVSEQSFAHKVATSLTTRDDPPGGIVRSRQRGCDSLVQSLARSSSRRGTVLGSPTDVHAAFSFARVHPHSDGIAWQSERQGTRASATFSSARHPRRSPREGDSSQGRFVSSGDPTSRLFREFSFLQSYTERKNWLLQAN